MFQEHFDLRGLNIRQLEEQIEWIGRAGLIVTERIKQAKNAIERDILIQERWYLMERGLAALHFRSIKQSKKIARLKEETKRGKKEVQRLKEGKEKDKEEFQRLSLEQERAYERLKLTLKELEFKSKLQDEEARAEKERKDKEIREQWAEIIEQSKLMDDEYKKKGLQRQEQELRGFQESQDHLREINDLYEQFVKEIRAIQKDEKEIRWGTAKAHQGGFELGCNRNEAETCDHRKPSKTRAEKIALDRFDPELIPSSGHNPLLGAHEDVILTGHNVQRECQDAPEYNSDEQRSNSDKDGYATHQQTKFSDDIDDGTSKPVVNLPKVVERLTKMRDFEIDRNSAPVWKCSSNPQERSLFDYNYQTLHTSAGHCSSINEDDNKYPELVQASIRSQMAPFCVGNKQFAPRLTAEQLEKGRLSKSFNAMPAPGSCDISKHSGLSDDKVVFY